MRDHRQPYQVAHRIQSTLYAHIWNVVEYVKTVDIYVWVSFLNISMYNIAFILLHLNVSEKQGRHAPFRYCYRCVQYSKGKCKYGRTVRCEAERVHQKWWMKTSSAPKPAIPLKNREQGVLVCHQISHRFELQHSDT